MRLDLIWLIPFSVFIACVVMSFYTYLYPKCLRCKQRFKRNQMNHYQDSIVDFSYCFACDNISMRRRRD